MIKSDKKEKKRKEEKRRIIKKKNIQLTLKARLKLVPIPPTTVKPVLSGHRILSGHPLLSGQ